MGSVRGVPPPRARRALPFLLVAGVLAACGTSGGTTAGTSPVALDGGGSGSGQASAVGDGATSRLSAELSGLAVVPEHGDPDATGRATVVVEPGRSQLCYRIEVTGVTGVDGTSLHEGAVGARGAVVLGLDPPEGGSVEGCVTADSALLERVGRSPQDYYVNVRSEDHPDGAVRGQLAAQGA
jgi:CHRD domain